MEWRLFFFLARALSCLEKGVLAFAFVKYFGFNSYLMDSSSTVDTIFKLESLLHLWASSSPVSVDSSELTMCTSSSIALSKESRLALSFLSFSSLLLLLSRAFSLASLTPRFARLASFFSFLAVSIALAASSATLAASPSPVEFLQHCYC